MELFSFVGWHFHIPRSYAVSVAFYCSVVNPYSICSVTSKGYIINVHLLHKQCFLSEYCFDGVLQHCFGFHEFCYLA